MTEVNDIFKEEASGDVMDLADRYIELRLKRERLEKQAAEIASDEKVLQETLINQMIAKGLKNIKREDKISISTTKKIAFYVKPDSKIEFLEAVKDQGDGGMIKEDIPWQTMNSMLKKLEEVLHDKDAPTQLKVEAQDKYQEYTKYIDKQERQGLMVNGLKNKV